MRRHATCCLEEKVAPEDSQTVRKRCASSGWWVRIGRMNSEFVARMRITEAAWRGISASLKRQEQAANQDPAVAARVYEKGAHDEYRYWQSILRNRFGIDSLSLL
jgi:hypothetical protein